MSAMGDMDAKSAMRAKRGAQASSLERAYGGLAGYWGCRLEAARQTAGLWSQNAPGRVLGCENPFKGGKTVLQAVSGALQVVLSGLFTLGYGPQRVRPTLTA